MQKRIRREERVNGNTKEGEEKAGSRGCKG